MEDFREVEPHLDRFTSDELGRLLDEWAEEEFLVDNVTKAIELNEKAISHYRERGDRRSQSRALGRGAHFHENAGHRDLAEERARGAVDVLGTDAAGADLAEALEANAYLQWMAGNFEMVPELVRQKRLTPAAAVLAEYGWITRDADLSLSRFRAVMTASLEKGFSYSPGAIAFWLWKLGELGEPPEGIAEPYRLVIEGDAHDAAAIWDEKGVPYERALALMHGDRASQLEALDLFEALGATAVAGRLRASLREQGVTVPRGKGKDTRTHAAGLTARQAEVLQLLGEGLTNVEIADELFVSPRTVENHVSAILAKLDAATRTEAVARARSEDLLASAP